VELFGHPFEAPLAAAELARASGCALIGVTIVRRRDGYAVKVLPEFAYDRRALGDREVRRELTRQILRAFEPQIRQDIDQWYQFVSHLAKGRVKSLVRALRFLNLNLKLPGRNTIKSKSKRAQLDTTAIFSPSSPKGGEGRGEEADYSSSNPLAPALSRLAGRGSRQQCQVAPRARL